MKKLLKIVSAVLVFGGFLMVACAVGTCDYFEEIREAYALPIWQVIFGLLAMVGGTILINIGEMKNGEK